MQIVLTAVDITNVGTVEELVFVNITNTNLNANSAEALRFVNITNTNRLVNRVEVLRFVLTINENRLVNSASATNTIAPSVKPTSLATDN
jgi:hypothetical protein